MFKGGYCIVDFGDADLTSGNATTIAGVHEVIERKHRKVTCLSGVTLDGVEYPDMWVFLDNSEGTYSTEVMLGGQIYTITITAADVVTFTAKE